MSSKETISNNKSCFFKINKNKILTLKIYPIQKDYWEKLKKIYHIHKNQDGYQFILKKNNLRLKLCKNNSIRKQKHKISKSNKNHLKQKILICNLNLFISKRGLK